MMMPITDRLLLPVKNRQISRCIFVALQRSFTLLLLLYPFTTSMADDYQSHEMIKSRINGFIVNHLGSSGKTDIHIRIDRLDSRLKLTRCESELTPFLPSGVSIQGNISLGVRCDLPKPWTVYVPVRVDIYQNVLAATRPMLKGQTISEKDIRRVRQKITAYDKGLFHNSAEIIGMAVKRFVGNGKLFTARHVEAPRLVRRGDEVTLLAGSKSLTVRMVGKALADGSKGELIQVQNSATNRIIEGIVTSPGIVKVKM